MRWKVAVFLCFVLFFGIEICGSNVGNNNGDGGDVNGDNGGGSGSCDIQEFLNVTKTKKFAQLDKNYYRFLNRGLIIYVGEEPLFFWAKSNTKITLQFSSIWKTPKSVKLFFEPYGNRKCLRSYDITAMIEVSSNFSECGCEPFNHGNEKYVPFKVWTENGSVQIMVSL
uniref:Uncharacterized protein n=1 Tax=Panagrolaimus davidi TaxID=227884 RepID=A0A914QJA8_9BILA